MTQRLTSFLVTLTADTRTDDAAPILDAIRLLRGVCSVVPVEADHVSRCAEERAKYELQRKVLEVLK